MRKTNLTDKLPVFDYDHAALTRTFESFSRSKRQEHVSTLFFSINLFLLVIVTLLIQIDPLQLRQETTRTVEFKVSESIRNIAVYDITNDWNKINVPYQYQNNHLALKLVPGDYRIILEGEQTLVGMYTTVKK